MKKIFIHIGNVTEKYVIDKSLWLNDNQHPTLLLNDVIKRLEEGQIEFVTNNNAILSYFTCLLQASRLDAQIRQEYKTKIDSVDIIQYELNGTCNVLSKYNDWMPTDDNVCNNAVADFNEWYSDLLDFEQELNNKKKL